MYSKKHLAIFCYSTWKFPSGMLKMLNKNIISSRLQILIFKIEKFNDNYMIL